MPVFLRLELKIPSVNMILDYSAAWNAAIIGVCVAVIFGPLTWDREILRWYAAPITRLYNSRYWFLAKPLGYCLKCTAGQVAFWYYITVYGFAVFQLIAFVCVAICAVFVAERYGISR
jgi:hypothetical protein